MGDAMTEPSAEGQALDLAAIEHDLLTTGAIGLRTKTVLALIAALHQVDSRGDSYKESLRQSNNHVVKLMGEVEQLRQQVAELEARLSRKENHYD